MFMNEDIRVMFHDDLYHSTLLRMIYQRALFRNEPTTVIFHHDLLYHCALFISESTTVHF